MMDSRPKTANLRLIFFPLLYIYIIFDDETDEQFAYGCDKLMRTEALQSVLQSS